MPLPDVTVTPPSDPETNQQTIEDYVTGSNDPVAPNDPYKDTARHPGDVWPREQPSPNVPQPAQPPGTLTEADLNSSLGGLGSIEAALLASLNKKTPHVNPEVASAAKYYFQLYGKTPPKGFIEGMVKQGLDVYTIQDMLLEQGKKDDAPGYDDIRYRNLLASGESLYFQLWGEDAPPNYIDNMVSQGMNLQEIMANERAKPAFKNTKTYQNQADSLAQQLAQLLGTV